MSIDSRKHVYPEMPLSNAMLYNEEKGTFQQCETHKHNLEK